jgi:chaperone BCS1
MSVCLIALSNPQINDSNLLHLIQTAPSYSVILFEDIDAIQSKSIVAQRAKKSSSKETGEEKEMVPSAPQPMMPPSNALSLSGLLNAMDGLAAAEGQVTIMTTNHIEVIDDALLRPGRVDLRVAFDLATPDDQRRYVKHFYERYARTRDLDSVADCLIEKDGCSMAFLQGRCMEHRTDPEYWLREAGHIQNVCMP